MELYLHTYVCQAAWNLHLALSGTCQLNTPLGQSSSGIHFSALLDKTYLRAFYDDVGSWITLGLPASETLCYRLCQYPLLKRRQEKEYLLYNKSQQNFWKIAQRSFVEYLWNETKPSCFYLRAAFICAEVWDVFLFSLFTDSAPSYTKKVLLSLQLWRSKISKSLVNIRITPFLSTWVENTGNHTWPEALQNNHESRSQ